MRRSKLLHGEPFARVNFRGSKVHFGAPIDSLLHHMYIVGKTGAGKTTLLSSVLRSNASTPLGFALIDPHGDLADQATESNPSASTLTVAPARLARDLSYNPLTQVSAQYRPLVASGLMDVFRMMWPDAWGPRMEHMLRNAILALLDQPHATLPDILRLFSNQTFREAVMHRIENKQVRYFWKEEFPKYTYRYQADSIAPIQSKVGAFLADPRIYRFLTSTENPLRFRRIMDEGQRLIVNLSKGQLGTDSSALLGGLITTSLGLAAFSRAEIPENERKPFFIYIDEFQNFTTLALAEMLSELRKYKVGMVLAHQYLHQLKPEIRHAVLGNVGTIISFRLGPEDAAFMAKEFEPVFDRLDLMNLPNHHIYLKLMIDGAPSKPFSATTLHPDEIQGLQ